MIGVTIVIAVYLALKYTGVSIDINGLLSWNGGIGAIGIVLMFFSTPYGYLWASDTFAPNVDDGIYFAGFSRKVAIGLFLGWVFFLFYLFRFIIRKIKNNGETQ